MKLVYLCLFLTVPLAVAGQEYRLKQFRVEDGLPSNVIKAVTQDSLGFFWIATDEGIVKFDGVRFTRYKGAMHSQYAKGFLHGRSGKLYVYGDLDLIEIVNELDTVIFKSVLRGTRNPTDSTLWFPKTMYEDRDEDLWLAEPQSVVRLRRGSLIRYNFGIEDRSPQFLRSFNFFEDRQGYLFAVAYSGNVYVHDAHERMFIKEEIKFPSGVNDIKMIDSVLWIASGYGLYRSELLPDGAYSKPVKVSPDINVSHLVQIDSTTLLVSTFQQMHYFLDISNGFSKQLPFKINTVNSAYLSAENDLWMASNEGVILLQKNLFYSVATPDEATFVEGIAEDPKTQFVYHCTMGNLYKVESQLQSSIRSSRVMSIPNGYFQSLAFGPAGLWAANAFGVYLINDEKIARRWDFEGEGRFIHDVVLDQSGNLWLSQAGNKNVISITPALTEKRYQIPLKPESIVNCVREGSNGIYVAANGLDGYLFFKSKTDSVFKNISVPLTIESRGDFTVNDLVVTDSLLWLATSEGLIRFNGRSLKPIDLGDVYSRIAVQAVRLLDKKFLVFNNSFGLFRYDVTSGDYWRYDESNGLPSNTITARGIFIDHKSCVWVGTSVGLAVSTMPLTTDRETPAPHFTSAQINGVEQRFTRSLRLPFGSFFTVSMSCISFPSDRIQMQYRLPSIDSAWHTISDNLVTLTDLPAGGYAIETRAKKNGGYGWSRSSVLNFEVQKPFWQQIWFMASALLLVSLIAWVSFVLATYINRKRRQYLEALVSQRTIELKGINEELSMRNSELDRFVYSTSHDLSAPLKSIRGLIMVAKMENPTGSQLSYLGMMERSVKKLETFIADVINYSRNTRAPLEMAPINFKLLIQQILDDHHYAPNYEKITFTVEDSTKTILISDEMRLRIIFNNLISNAIKFHFIDDPNRSPYVRITADELPDKFIFVVRDNGSGIHPQLKDKIFDMFFRATDMVSGSGLGLYILRETVHKLGGEVSVDTELGVGTTFAVTLPK